MRLRAMGLIVTLALGLLVRAARRRGAATSESPPDRLSRELFAFPLRADHRSPPARHA